MIIEHLIKHGLFFGLIVTGSLFVIMVTTSPRIWGYSDYPDCIKEKVPPQTIHEKRVASLIAIPWLVFVLGFPIYSTLALKSKLSGEIPFWLAYLNLTVLYLAVTIGDLLVLDWLVISKITPRFIIIPGTEPGDYKDFSHHFRGHIRATMIILGFFVVVSGIISSV